MIPNIAHNRSKEFAGILIPNIKKMGLRSSSFCIFYINLQRIKRFSWTMPSNFKIFISYRRKGGYDTAKLLYEKLKLDGYYVFFDIDIMERGNFDYELEKRVRKCKDFLLILSPGIFDRFLEKEYNPKEDWVRQEITCAINTHKNIIPLVMSGFTYPRNLPNDIRDITRKNFIEYNPVHFEAAYTRLKEVFLISKPGWYARYKKRIRNFFIIMFLVFVAILFLVIYEILRQKDLETERRIAEVKMEAQHREDSIIRELKIARVLDSIVRKVPSNTPIKKTSKKSLHWGGPNDVVGQEIFGKISAVGMKKTKCIDDGILINANKPTCKTNAGKVTCSYSPMLTLTTCKNKYLNSMKKDVTFKSNPQKNEAMAKEELAKKLRSANFNDWILAIKKY